MQEEQKKRSDREYYIFALRIVGDFGATLAVPVVLFALIGRYFDQKWHTAPYLTVLGFVLAALLSARMIYKKSKKYGEDYSNLK